MTQSTTLLARPTRVRYGVLAFVCGLSMITYLDRVCFGVAAPLIAAELGLTGVSQLKWTFVAFSMAYGLFEIPAGWMGDRWGPRGTLIRIVCCWSLFTALTGVIGMRWGSITLGGLTSLIVLRLLFGAGEAGAYPNITRAIHNWFPVDRWETAQGLVWMSGRLAGGLTPLIWAVLVAGTPYSGPLVPWRAAFFLFGVVGVIWAIVFGFWFRDHPEEHSSVNHAERSLIGSRTDLNPQTHFIPWIGLLTNPSLIALCIMYSLITYGWYFNITYLAGYLKDRYELAENDLWGAVYKGAPLWVGAIGCAAGGISVNIATRWTNNRRLGRQIICIPALLMCAACWWGARMAPNIHWFCFLISMAAFGIDLTIGAAWASCQDIGHRHAGVTAATMNMFGTFGASIAGWVTGSIVEAKLVDYATRSGIAVADIAPAEAKILSIAGFDVVFSTYAIIYVLAATTWLFIDPAKLIKDDRRTSTSF